MRFYFASIGDGRTFQPSYLVGFVSALKADSIN